jgi:uncharacterized protein YecE (DUF72 family)
VRPALKAEAQGREERALAAALGPGLRLGTSSWAFPGWAGQVYEPGASERTLARVGLPAYAAHPLLRTVGIDRTFYAPVTADVLAAYAAQVPEDFRFLVKAHEHCTLARFPDHARYGGERGAWNARAFEPGYATDAVVEPFVAGLGARGGVLLFQLPPQPIAALGGAAGFPERLHRFLSALPKGPTYAVELRNHKLLTPRYAEALRAAGAVHGHTHHPTMPDVGTQARVVGPPPPGQPLVVRWMLQRTLTYEAAKAAYEPFDRLVDPDPEARAQIAALCLAHLDAHPDPTGLAYVVVNNKAEGSSPASIVALAHAVATARGRAPAQPTAAPDGPRASHEGAARPR